MNDRADCVVVGLQHGHYLLRFRGFGKGGEAAQIAEQDRDLAPVAFEDSFFVRGDDHLRKLRCQEPAKTAYALELGNLRRHPPLKVRIEGPERLALVLDGVVQRLDPQNGTYTCDQRGMIKGLCQVVVCTGFETGNDILHVGPCGDQDDRHEGNRGIPFQPPRHLDAVKLRHRDIEQDQIGQVRFRAGQRLLPICRVMIE